MYTAVVALAVAVQLAIIGLRQSQAVQVIAPLVISSLAGSVLYAFTLGDVDGSEPALAWHRALERAWATIVVNFFESFVLFAGYASLGIGDLMDRLLAIPVLLIGISLNFGDVHAVTTDDDRWWLLVPSAIAQSIRVTWSTGATMIRAIVLVLLQVLIERICAPLPTWASIAVETLTFVPIAVVTVYVYLDAIGYEPKNPCG